MLRLVSLALTLAAVAAPLSPGAAAVPPAARRGGAPGARRRARRVPLEARAEAALPPVRRQGARRLPRELRARLVPARRPLALRRLRGAGRLDGRDRGSPAAARPATSTCGYARHGVRYLADVMWDREHGGFHTHVDLAGRATQGVGPPPGRSTARPSPSTASPRRTRRPATPSPSSSPSAAGAGSRTTTATASAPATRSAVKPDGQHFPLPTDEGKAARASIEGPAHHRTMNDHIHLLEAYAELLRSWPDPALRKRTEELLAFVRDRLFVEPGCLYIALWPDGRVVPAPVSFGHDVETAFLMIEAEEALGREPSAATLRAARMLVDQALAHGYDPARGQLFEYGSAYGPPDRPVDRVVGAVRGVPRLPAHGRAVRPRGRPLSDRLREGLGPRPRRIRRPEAPRRLPADGRAGRGALRVEEPRVVRQLPHGPLPALHRGPAAAAERPEP